MNCESTRSTTGRGEKNRGPIFLNLNHDGARVPPKVFRRGIALLPRRCLYRYGCRTFWKLIFNFRFHDGYLAAHELREVLGVMDGLRVRGL